MPIFLLNIFGWIWAHRRLVLIGVAVLMLLMLLLWVRSCLNRPAKLDLQEIQKAQQAIRENDRQEMVEILAASDVREQGIDNSILQAEESTRQAKKNYTGLSNDELAAELERRSKE
jgi:uncharacterized protein YpuA (DUF1002 family)